MFSVTECVITADVIVEPDSTEKMRKSSGQVAPREVQRIIESCEGETHVNNSNERLPYHHNPSFEAMKPYSTESP